MVLRLNLFFITSTNISAYKYNFLYTLVILWDLLSPCQQKRLTIFLSAYSEDLTRIDSDTLISCQSFGFSFSKNMLLPIYMLG